MTNQSKILLPMTEVNDSFNSNFARRTEKKKKKQKKSGRIDSQFTFCTIDNNYMYTMHIIKKI